MLLQSATSLSNKWPLAKYRHQLVTSTLTRQQTKSFILAFWQLTKDIIINKPQLIQSAGGWISHYHLTGEKQQSTLPKNETPGASWWPGGLDACHAAATSPVYYTDVYFVVCLSVPMIPAISKYRQNATQYQNDQEFTAQPIDRWVIYWPTLAYYRHINLL